MANKRMFSKDITDADPFIEMSAAAQALYFHLNQGADDDGFNNQVQMAMWKAHASIDDLKVLMAKNYVIRFESGLIVIKHWRLHNTLRKDRYTATNYQEELSFLGIKDNGTYTLGGDAVTNWLPDGCHSIDKSRLDKDSIGEVIEEAEPPKTTRHKYGLYENVIFTDEEYLKVKEEFPTDHSERIERLSEYIASTGKKYKNHLATIRAWSRKETQKKGGNVFLEIAQEEGIV